MRLHCRGVSPGAAAELRSRVAAESTLRGQGGALMLLAWQDGNLAEQGS